MAVEVENTEVEETEEVDTSNEGDESSDEEYVAPDKESWEKLNRVAAARKAERDRFKRELAALKAKEEKPEVDEKAAEAAKWRTTAARSSAAVAIQAAGFSGSAKAARTLTALLKLSDAEPDENGDFDFEDEIDDLKESFPTLFEQKRTTQTRRPATADRGGNTDAPGRDRTSERMLKQAGYR